MFLPLMVVDHPPVMIKVRINRKKNWLMIISGSPTGENIQRRKATNDITVRSLVSTPPTKGRNICGL